MLPDDLKKVVRNAGEAVMEFYGGDFGVEKKEDDSPVTQADLASEKAILTGLIESGYGASEGYAFLSEEGVDDLKRLECERVWVIDPLDGTKEFIAGIPEFSVMVGLVEKRDDGLWRPVASAVFNPAADRLYFAEKGKGAFVEIGEGGGGDRGEKRVVAVEGNGAGGRIKTVKLEASSETDPAKMKMLVSRSHLLPFEVDFSKKHGIGELVPCGSAGVKACKVAEGSAEIYINSSDKTWEWDICAADLIVREAGGVVVDMKGAELTYNKEDARNLEGFVVGGSWKFGNKFDLGKALE